LRGPTKRPGSDILIPVVKEI